MISQANLLKKNNISYDKSHKPPNRTKLPNISMATPIMVTIMMKIAAVCMFFLSSFGNINRSAICAKTKVMIKRINFTETTFSMGLEKENQVEILTW